jgi:hypothetical protein
MKYIIDYTSPLNFASRNQGFSKMALSFSVVRQIDLKFFFGPLQLVLGQVPEW